MDLSSYKVIKHNDLVESKSSFSAMEHKIILLAMAQIKMSDEEFKMYKVPIRSILGERNKTEYSLVRKSVEKLHKSIIKIETKEDWTTYSFITKAHGKKGTSYIEIQFHKEVQHLLLGLKSRYTTYTLGNVINFKKNYSLRIYELCKQRQKIGKRELSVNYMRTLFSLEGKYKDFNIFKRRVIDSALEEINQHSDLFLRYEEIKEGRRIEKLLFIIRQNQAITDEYQLKTLDEMDFLDHMNEKFLKLGFKPHEISQIRDKYTQHRITSILAYFEAHIEDINHPKAWIEKTLQEFVDKAEYKDWIDQNNQENNQENKKKIINTKTIEIQNLEDHIARDKSDIAEYQETEKLRPGDMQFRFKGKSVEEAIEELEDRVIDTEAILKKAERDLNKLLQ